MATASAEKGVLFEHFDGWKFLVASRKMGYKLTSKRRIGMAVFFAHYMGFQVAAFT
jgi:hypothetical protein